MLESFEKERPLLGEEQREALVRRHLADVGLYLGKVGVRRRVEAQVLGDAPPQRPAQVRLAFVDVGECPGRAVHLGGELGRRIHHQTTMESRESDEGAGLDQKTRARANRGSPRVFGPRVLGLTHDLHPPILRVARLVAQRLEGNANFDLVAEVREPAARLVYVVGIEVDDRVEPATRLRAAGGGLESVTPHAVLLNTERIDREEERAAVVVIGVEEDLDAVVGVDVVPIGQRGSHDLAVRLVGADSEVDRIGRVPDQHLGRICRGPPVHGAILRESDEPRSAQPDRLVEHAVHGHARLDAGDRDGELSGEAVVAVRGIGGGRLEGEEQGEHG